uniref:Potassium voltage-gated channel protein Shaw n=1 Tax=Magallana gigas TaxID=29159 RepID=A0A8W8JAP2_MAGGI|nr:potassium voltage-gated channel subfamily C member 3-like [Crassostrea gigas]
MTCYFNISLRGTQFITSSISVRDLLDKLSKEGHAEIKTNGDYFLDRNPVLFHYVLDYFSGRKFHLPKGICAIEAREELEFWMIPVDAVPNCCYEVLFDDNLSSYEEIEKLEQHLTNGVLPEERIVVSKKKLQNIRDTLNKAAADPFSCLLGKIWFVIVAALTLTTTACFVISMYDDFRMDRESIPTLPNNATYNLFFSNPKRKTLIVKAAPIESVILEGTCNALLLVDLLIRFVISYQKKSFILNIQNVVEVIVGVFCFLVIYIERNPQIAIENPNLDSLIVIIGGFYSLRVMKLLRLAESTAEMKILKLCFQKSWKILSFLVMVFTIFSTIFGCGMFWAEFNNAETFPNIGISIWWAIVTITTVGYGDYYPKSIFGYIVASVTALFGLCLIAIPIATLSSNFSTFYRCYTFRKKYLSAKKTMKRKQMKEIVY